jgi:ATP-dependent DNA helicase RecG
LEDRNVSAGLDAGRVEQLIRAGESLTVEFKGEERGRISDRDIYEAVVCMANTDGGVLLIGVEDDRRVTGARPRHETTTEPRLLQAAIFNNTMPSINTRVSVHDVDDCSVVAIEVDAYPAICATMDGRSVRRVEGPNGPECRPFYPHEHMSRRIDLGLVDYSALRIDDASWNDLDPLEIERLRQMIERLNGDRVLLDLDDRELVQALRLVETRDGELVPNVAGMLLVGREQALRRTVPTHAIAFQVLDEHGSVVLNDWFHGPLLRTLDAIEARFTARNQEQEILIGLVRLPIPDYAPDAFREALNNAVLHRDYARRDTVYVQLHDDHVLVTNPGGFLEGIRFDNLLVHEPKPRNPLLAAAFRRIGLVETTGRGIDKIYVGQLRYGRPLPDYSRSDREAVRLELRGGETSLEFARLVFEQSRAGRPLNLGEMIVLNHLQYERRVDAQTVARLIQRNDAAGRAVLERVVERGLVDAQGKGRNRAYYLSAALYRSLGAPAGYVRMRGFDAIQQEAMILQFVDAYGRITRREVVELCRVGERQASYLLRRLVTAGVLELIGERRGAFYRRP